jgi:hypothetical protein
VNLVTAFDVYQRVIIKELGLPALIVAIKFDGAKILYELEYWWNSELKVVWQFENEIQEICPRQPGRKNENSF